ncbi:MAG: M1 family aminopeptidase [bacterium]
MKRYLYVTILFATVGIAQTLTEGKFLPFGPPSPAFAESTHHFDCRHYTIDLDLPMNSGAMTAHARVELIARRDHFDTFSLHINSLVCDSVHRDGNICTFTQTSERLLINLDREFQNGESLAVDIYYHRNAGTANRGFYFYSRGGSGRLHNICYSTTEPADARYWFPCFDEPWDKAERGCRVNITTPDSFSGCANGVLDSITLANGKKTCWWTHRYPITTYLITFAASRWANFNQWFYPAPGESLLIQNFMWPEDSALAVNAFRNLPDMLAFFSDTARYGPYPFATEKYGHVVAYPFQWGGMENQTLTMVHRYWIQMGNDNGIAHELSHHWWGDMVTCLDWRNIWLNEGFATYSDELYTWHQRGLPAFINLIQNRARDYFREESTDLHPIYAPPPGHEFDWGHSYCKGAWVQHMLRYVEGDTVWESPGIFFRALRIYGDSFRYRNASTEDYRRIHEQVSGLNLDWFFNEWVYSPGYPNYEIGWQSRGTGHGWEVTIDLAQHNISGAPGIFHIPVEIKLTLAQGDTTIRYPVTENPQRNVFTVSSEPTSLIFDPNEWILDQHNVTVGLLSDPNTEPTITAPELSVRFNPTRPIFISYALPRSANLRLEVFAPDGRKVKTLACQFQPAGRYTLEWYRQDDAGNRVPAGTYLLNLTVGNKRVTKKFVILN